MMENSSRHSRASQPQSLATKQRRSGYEPSDTETEWLETPWHGFNRINGDLDSDGWPDLTSDQGRNTSPLKLSRRLSAKFKDGLSSPIKPSRATPVQRRHSKSPYKPRRDDGNVDSTTPVSDVRRNVSPFSPERDLDSRRNVSPFSNPEGRMASDSQRNISPFSKPEGRMASDSQRNISPFLKPEGRIASDSQRNTSPFSKPEGRRHISPYKPARKDHDLVNNRTMSSNRRQNYRQINKNVGTEERGGQSQVNETSRVSGKSNYSRRSLSAPKPTSREKDQLMNFGCADQNGDRTPSPLSRNIARKEREASHRHAPSVGELNEMVANAKISRVPVNVAPNFQSTDSISPGDIFFSRECADLTTAMQKIIFPKNGGVESIFISKPQKFTARDSAPHQQSKTNGNFGHGYQGNSSSTVLTRTTMTSSSAVSRHTSGKISTSTKYSVVSGRTSGSFGNFVANRKKSQTETWFSCIKKGSCRTSKSPEKNREFDEASFIENAFVVESLRQFWADKHQPASLIGFTYHKQQAQLLKQLVSHEIRPHILLKGPAGSGKKALTRALLREIYGDPAWNISHDIRYFHIEEARPTQVVVPVTSSAHHVELNVYLEPNARYAVMALVKQISSSYNVTPEISNTNFKADDKVMVLQDVDKAADNIQHLIKWIMDCYTDSCKLILCCEDDTDIPEQVKNSCKVIKVDAPVSHEIIEVLIQIARKEDFDLPTSFAAKIATKSKQNLRKAIMALEACKAHNYPFVEDQPIPMGWEEILEELAAEILVDPSHKRLFIIRGKFQKLLVDFVHPKLILQKLVEQFLKGVEASLKRELYYWHSYYDKRLTMGTSALLKLEEFVAKFMSLRRKSFNNQQF
ncbi:Replication factor C subunit like [Actinidia chinensis var. chinensis]|uniref:Replication factor C subunit like n=1 Tax=Actinidia chinensis var. chinensis TaxID=1590841 RepID=A0A2R6RLD1_ACTCC|nr:Replication factor C subunit like [Actinidia chinensis var. chinensis]